MTTAGDLLSDDGCPACDYSVIRVSSELKDANPPVGRDANDFNEFECANGHVWVEEV